jgi:hypothetical protein
MADDIDDKHRTEHREVAPRGPGHPPYVIPDERVAEVADACRLRMPETGIARSLGINYRTWMRIRDEDDRVASALAEARKMEEEELVALLLDRARKGETVPLLFALKSRHGYRDQGPTNGSDAPTTHVSIILPDAMSPRAYLDAIDVTPRRTEGGGR